MPGYIPVASSNREPVMVNDANLYGLTRTRTDFVDLYSFMAPNSVLLIVGEGRQQFEGRLLYSAVENVL